MVSNIFNCWFVRQLISEPKLLNLHRFVLINHSLQEWKSGLRMALCLLGSGYVDSNRSELLDLIYRKTTKLIYSGYIFELTGDDLYHLKGALATPSFRIQALKIFCAIAQYEQLQPTTLDYIEKLIGTGSHEDWLWASCVLMAQNRSFNPTQEFVSALLGLTKSHPSLSNRVFRVISIYISSIELGDAGIDIVMAEFRAGLEQSMTKGSINRFVSLILISILSSPTHKDFQRIISHALVPDFVTIICHNIPHCTQAGFHFVITVALLQPATSIFVVESGCLATMLGYFKQREHKDSARHSLHLWLEQLVFSDGGAGFVKNKLVDPLISFLSTYPKGEVLVWVIAMTVKFKKLALSESVDIPHNPRVHSDYWAQARKCFESLKSILFN